MGGIIDPIEDIIEDVIDVIKDVGDFVQDDIVIPVADAVEGTLKAIEEDPVRALAYIAAASGPWAVWAVPLVAAADTAEQGGDIGDILEAAAKAYVVSQISPQVGGKAGAYVGSATGSVTAGAIAAGATTAATSAIVLGQDPVQAALTGGVQAGVSAAMAQVRQNMAPSLPDSEFMGSDSTTGAGGALDPIPEAVFKVVETQLAYTLSGQDGTISPEVMANAILQATVTTETMKQFLNEADYTLSDGQLAALTNGVVKTTSAAINGGDISQAALKSIAEYGAKELFKTFDKEGRDVIDKITGDYAETEKKAGEVDFIAEEYEAAVTQYNNTREEMLPRFDERARLKAEMDQAKLDFEASPSQPSSDAYNNKINEYNEYSTELDKDYAENYAPKLAEFKNQSDTLIQDYNTANAEYTELADGLIQNADQLDEVLKPTYDATNRAFVQGMTNDDFNIEDYIELNNLSGVDDEAAIEGESFDPYLHWLTTGKEEKLPVNKEQYDNQFSEAASDLVLNSLAEAGLTLASLNQGQMKDVQDHIVNNYAGKLYDLKNADTKQYGLELGKKYLTDGIESSSASEEDKVIQINNINEASLEGIKSTTNDPAIKNIIKKQTIEYNKNNVTDTQIADGTAVLKYNHGTGLINWEDIGGLQIPKWNDKYGALTVERRDSVGRVQIVNKDTGVVLETEELRITIHPTLANLKETNPEKYVEQVSKLDENAGKIINEAANNQPIYELSKNIFKMAAETETGQDVLNSGFVKNFSGIATQAGGELVQAANGMLVFAGINPASTPAGKWARDSIKLGQDMKTEEWQAASTGMFKSIDDANIESEFLEDGVTPNPKAGQLKPGSSWDHFTNTMATAYGEFKNTPGVFMAEIIGKEILQELPILVLSGGAGNVTKAFAKELGEDLAQKMASRASLGTAVTLDAVEAGGGSAAGAFEEAYAVALKSGMNETEAGNFALDVAQKAGVTAITASFVTNKIGGATFEKAIYGTKKVDGSLASKFNDFAKVTGTEAAQGGIEETAVQGVIELALHPLDPNRDVGGNLAKSLTFGVLAGGGTSSSLYAGKQVIDNSSDYITNVLTNTNPGISNIVKSYDGTPESLTSAESQLSDLGLTSVTQNNVLSVMSPNDYTSSTNVFEAFKNVEGVYTPKINEVDQFVGKFSNEEFTNNFDTYIDKGTVDREEIIDAAAAENVTLTEDQIEQYIGQKNEIETITGAKIEFDPLGTTTTESTDFFKAIGYNPSESEIGQFTGPVSEAEQQEAISKFADPLMTDRDEVAEYFSAIGYNPSETDITQFIGQIEETKQKTAIGEFTDPKMVDETEAFNAFKEAGLEGARPDDIQSLIGQYDQNLLAGKVEEALPGARYNVLDYNLGEQTKKVDALSELIGTKDTKIDALSSLLTDQTTKTDALNSLIGTKATDTDQATGLYGTIADQQTDFTTQLDQQSTDFNTLINQQAADATAKIAADDEAAKIAAATKATKDQQMQNAQNLYRAVQPTTVSTEQQGVADIGTPYDFKSIFRDAGQETFYNTPYRNGGQVVNINDRLLKLIGGS